MILLPVPSRQWKPPSQAQSKDQLGRENRTRFRLRARLDDGLVVWCGWFDDRDDADAFLWALVTGSLIHERELWRLPMPWWNFDYVGLYYDFATLSFITTPAGSLQTSTSPVDWNNSNNSVECVGPGGSGGAQNGATTLETTGGGGGAYSKITNFTFAAPGSTTYQWQVGAGGAAVTTTTASSGINGNPGGSATWFNSASDPGFGSDNTKCSADFGRAGVTGAPSQNGGVGGATANGWGQTKNAGGRGGNASTNKSIETGGGGAGGPTAAGNNGTDSSTQNTSTAGGSADNGGTGAGSGGAGTSASPGGAGGNGTEWDALHGCGGGGGACHATVGSGTVTGGSGGNYGGGGGGARNASNTSPTAQSGAGIQGIIVLTYSPAFNLGKLYNINQANSRASFW